MKCALPSENKRPAVVVNTKALARVRNPAISLFLPATRPVGRAADERRTYNLRASTRLELLLAVSDRYDIRTDEYIRAIVIPLNYNCVISILCELIKLS